jgi:ABC-type dipeptide/oligopeptide/nickel transport system permease subunit
MPNTEQEMASVARRGKGARRLAWMRFRRSRAAVCGAVIALAMAAAGLLAPLAAPYPYDAQVRQDAAQGPSARHWMGVDPLARDVFSRVLYGARVSLEVAVAATSVSVLIGVAAGALAGYLG